MDDMRRMAKQTMQDYNWTPDQFYELDYFELTEMLAVGDENSRLVDPAAVL